MTGPALCDGCKARITFVTVTKAAGGRARMVLNERPDPAGNVAVRTSGHSKVGRVLGKHTQPDSDEVLYMPHFATCTNPPPRKPKRPAPKPPKPPQPAQATQATQAAQPAQADLFTTITEGATT